MDSGLRAGGQQVGDVDFGMFLISCFLGCWDEMMVCFGERVFLIVGMEDVGVEGWYDLRRGFS